MSVPHSPPLSVVRYALRSTSAPIAVSAYTYKSLPAAERAALPTAGTLAAAITGKDQ